MEGLVNCSALIAVTNSTYLPLPRSQVIPWLKTAVRGRAIKGNYFNKQFVLKPLTLPTPTHPDCCLEILEESTTPSVGTQAWPGLCFDLFQLCFATWSDVVMGLSTRKKAGRHVAISVFLQGPSYCSPPEDQFTPQKQKRAVFELLMQRLRPVHVLTSITIS